MSETLAVNSNVSHYRILQKLGAGGMGEVFLAEDKRLERKVALKILPFEVASNQERMRRFVLEAKSASYLNHPNIAHIYEIGESDGINFIAMEFVEGETLREKIYAEKLDLRILLKYLAQVADGLAKAHAAGIVHRDLKPDNIMISRDGFAKILDFGLAKLVETQNPHEKINANEINEAATAIMPQQQALSTPGIIMGTVGYMSPEQARGRKEIDQRSDIFSFGCVLFEAATGRQPFSSDSVIDTLHKIIHAPAPPIRDFNPNAPTELQRIIRRCLQKDAEERYQTIKDVAIELKELRRGMQTEAEIDYLASPRKSTTISDENATKFLPANNGQAPETDAVTIAPRSTSSAEYITGEIKRNKGAFTVALSILLLAAMGFGYWFFSSRSTSNNSSQINSIAVLPFENASGNADLDYLSDGVSESIIDRLSRLPQLKVIARSSSFRYRGQNLNLQEIANALGVLAIVTGRVVPRGDSYQIRVELVDVRDNKQLWGENSNRKASDVQILQADISREIAENLRLRLSGAEQQQLASQGTTNPQAYELRLKGRFYHNKAGVENFHRAAEYYEQAVAIDPNYALAYAELAEDYRQGAGRGLDQVQRRIKREAAVQRALQLNPNLAEAHSALADLKRDAWQWQEAEAEYKRAIELNPNFDRAHMGYAMYLSMMKRHDEAVAEIKRAREISPLSLIINASAGSIFLYARRYDEAVEAIKRRLELEQNLPVPYWRLGMIYEAKGMYAEAITNYQQAMRLGVNQILSNEEPRLGAIYAKIGERGKAEEILRKIKTSQRDTSVLRRHFAILYDALGMRDEALALLEKSYAERDDYGLPFIAVEPAYDNLRSDPRFQDLLRRMNLPQ